MTHSPIVFCRLNRQTLSDLFSQPHFSCQVGLCFDLLNPTEYVKLLTLVGNLLPISHLNIFPSAPHSHQSILFCVTFLSSYPKYLPCLHTGCACHVFGSENSFESHIFGFKICKHECPIFGG